MDDHAIVLNAGSSSLKFSRALPPTWRGASPRAGPSTCAGRSTASARRRDSRRRMAATHAWPTIAWRRGWTGAAPSTRSPRGSARAMAATRACSASAIASCTAARSTRGPTIVTTEVLADLRALVPLAPLHQPVQPRRHRRRVRANAGRAAGRLLRHQLSSRAAGGRRGGAAAARPVPRRRAAIWISRALVRVHRVRPA